MNVLLKAFTLYSTEKENIWDRASRKNDSSQILLAEARDGGIFLYEEYKKKDLGDAREHCRMFLQQMQEKGVALFVDGERALPEEAALKAVQEDSFYMADYVFGDTGNIEQVRFDKVTSR